MIIFFNVLIGKSTNDLLSINAWISIFLYMRLLFAAFQNSEMIIIATIIFTTIWLIVLIDFQYMIIMDETIIILLFLGIFATIKYDFDNLFSKIIYIFVVYGSIHAMAHAYHFYRGVKGIGAGDIKLLSVSTLLVGLDGLPLCLLYASLSAIFSLLLLKNDTKLITMQTKIPFGSHLAFSIWIVFVTGDFEAYS